ncbi:hypothetical protein Cme02nite_13160 [Catellatospora methionotrophica]|uniref:Uncharacterized protein n=1 Tax=Catellatospora methionotrophica TaxID=121620 RepID=A0A8J3LC76_9ACTN|nr:hypothetical protein [Catellatospora methionotrophica]GIG12984.1 hypothetical protein Cme02nite_13160 [Catellatospora methionotrophica]
MRKTSSIVAGCGLMLATLVTSLPAQAVPALTVDCQVAAPATGLTAGLTADRAPAYGQWLDTEPARQANRAVQTAARQALGVTGAKERIADQVRRGYIGTAIDHNTQTVTIVVTPEQRTRAAGLDSSLAGASRAADGALAMKTAVKVGCFSAERLAAADELLSGRAWHPDAARASFSYSLRAADSRFQVTFDPRFPAAAQALRDQLGEVAEVMLDTAPRTGRLNDGEAHFGGAGVRVNSGATNTCTTGFVARRKSVTGDTAVYTGGISAAHCFGNGQKIYSSTQYWGTASRESDYPSYDMLFVGAATETYDNVIHTDPCCPTQRNITAKRDPLIGDVVCLSGMTTKATCGVTVISLNAMICDAEGCTGGLMEGGRGGDIIVRTGDSGGPVYIRSGTSNAIALGMIIGCTSGCRGVVAEQLTNIESHLNATILTS